LLPILRYGVTASDILDRAQSGGELAVRMAIGMVIIFHIFLVI
jgi:hypothetical protein